MALLDNREDLWKAGDGDVGPSRAAYNAALNTLFKLGTEKSARGVDSILWRMEELFRSGKYGYSDMRPHVREGIKMFNGRVCDRIQDIMQWGVGGKGGRRYMRPYLVRTISLPDGDGTEEVECHEVINPPR